MKTLFIFILFIPSLTMAGSITINGKTWICEGSVGFTSNGPTCNGKPMTNQSASAGPCFGSSTKTHKIGGGQVDVRATVSPNANIKGTVCGRATIADSVIIQKGATINGPIKIENGAVIGRNSTINGGGTVGPNTIIGKNVTLNGNLQTSNTQIADNTTLNGDIVLDGVNLSGGITCSGDGSIRANPSTGVN